MCVGSPGKTTCYMCVLCICIRIYGVFMRYIALHNPSEQQPETFSNACPFLAELAKIQYGRTGYSLYIGEDCTVYWLLLTDGDSAQLCPHHNILYTRTSAMEAYTRASLSGFCQLWFLECKRSVAANKWPDSNQIPTSYRNLFRVFNNDNEQCCNSSSIRRKGDNIGIELEKKEIK